MKKKNFTDEEKNVLEAIVRNISNEYRVEFNKCGNLSIYRDDSPRIWWTLYRTPVNNGKLVWRRLWRDDWGCYRAHLLNVRGRKIFENKYGKRLGWDGVNAHASMDTFEEAIEYAIKYFTKRA